MFFPRVKSAIFAVALSSCALAASAQSMKEFLAKPETPLTYMGVDFSGTKYYGNPGTVAPEEMKSLFTKIDELLVTEADKYNLTKALRRTNVNYNISFAESVNLKIDPAAIITADEITQRGRLNPEKIEGMVNRYTYPAGSSGIGLVFIMEDIVKPKEMAVMWVTFVDLASKKVLYTDKLAGAGQGFGFRNHWAYSLYSAIKNIKSQQYGEWKKKFAKA